MKHFKYERHILFHFRSKCSMQESCREVPGLPIGLIGPNMMGCPCRTTEDGLASKSLALASSSLPIVFVLVCTNWGISAAAANPIERRSNEGDDRGGMTNAISRECLEDTLLLTPSFISVAIRVNMNQNETRRFECETTVPMALALAAAAAWRSRNVRCWKFVCSNLSFNTS